MTLRLKYYDKMHHEEELDLFCSCIRANISIMLHKTIYEINITLLLRTHFRPPSSVCNNFLMQGRNHGIDIGGVQMWALPQIFCFKFSRGSDRKNKQARPSTNE